MPHPNIGRVQVIMDEGCGLLFKNKRDRKVRQGLVPSRGGCAGLGLERGLVGFKEQAPPQWP